MLVLVRLAAKHVFSGYVNRHSWKNVPLLDANSVSGGELGLKLTLSDSVYVYICMCTPGAKCVALRTNLEIFEERQGA